MRIGIVSKFGAPDGLCIRADSVLRGLVDRGHEVHALTQSKQVDGIPDDQVHRFKAVWLNKHYSIDSFSSPRLIAKVCQKHSIDILHVQMNSGTTENFLPFFNYALPPLVVTFHLAYATGFYSSVFALAWKASLFSAKRYNEIILVDPSQKPYFLNYGLLEDRLSVIRNGVDIDLFEPPAKKKDNGIIDFVFVGRLSFDKGVNILLDAFGQYHCENPDSRLTLIGDGMIKNQIEDCVDDDSVTWIGSLDHDKIPAVLQKMDAFVIPQNIGGLGLSVMEAMSCGLPVITTAIGETTRLLGKDEGILVRPQSVSDVVDAMHLLGDDKKLRLSMGQQCRQKVEKQYSWKNQIGQIEDVYERAISKRKT
ncbi:MAG: glycosyltransferase family 4 protein [Candidatus Thorarchaeota archaeon]|jgi:glycosyltransferase involved in cell wall biosynthesis